MIETDEQRRWWFANHPEYSSSRKGKQRRRNKEEKVSPEAVDAYVDEALKFLSGPEAAFLKSIKRNFGTKAYSNQSEKKEEEAEHRAEVEYQKGWNDGYWAIRTNQAPPKWVIDDKSAYARGVREGAVAALDENEAWNQKWLDPFLVLLGTHPSRILGDNLKGSNQLPPSKDYDAHHLVPWRHWRAQVARDILADAGIDINEIQNGMWLERTFHRTLSNNTQYMENVTRLLREAQGSRPEVLKALDYMRDSLSNGKIPK